MERAQIIYAKKVLRTMHPLYNLDIELCLPFLDPVIGVTRRCMARYGWSTLHAPKNVGERTALADADGLKADDSRLKKEDLELADGERPPDEPMFDFALSEGEDPIGRLGYGVVSYFGLIYTFMVIFALITCINIPVMNNFASWHAYSNIAQLSWTAQYTVGNLGESESRCMSIKLVGDDLSIGCNTGLITEVTHFGVYAKDSEADQRNICTSTTGAATGLQCPNLSSKDHPFYTEKLEACKGQKSCTIHNVHEYIPLGGSGECQLSETDSLYLQYSCIVSDQELQTKRQHALLASVVNVFCMLVLLAVIKYRMGSISIEKREWDLQTVTASDYCVEIKLDADYVGQLHNKIKQEGFLPYESSGLRLKMFLIKKIEETIFELSGEEGRVADLNFAYQNSWLLDELRKRGEHIKFQRWDKLNEINAKITSELRQPGKIEECIMPKSAFVSIENELAYNVIATRDSIEIDLKNGQPKQTLKVAEAPEPTNVIWENRDLSKTIRYARLILVITAVLVVLFLTFLATVQAKAMTNDLIGKYDESINCNEIERMYPQAVLTKIAADEWIDYYKKGGEDIERQIASSLSCFCTAEYVEYGNDSAVKVYKSTDGTDVKTCSEIFADRGSVALVAMGVSFLIVGVNFALKVILVELIKSLRLKTVTLETNYTMITIFVGQFINTAVLIVLNNASFKDFDGGNGPLSLVFSVGTETDFSVNWYKTVGTTIMTTMLSQALWPLIEFGMFYSIINFTRCLDRSFGNDTFVSKAPSVQAYIDLYAGPVYLIHYRYAAILLQISVAFCYGCTMPPLYAIACVAFVILYINERLLVCYYYREPPAFDEEMTMLTLDLVKLIPYIMLPMAFWQLGNRQIFEAVINDVEYKSDIRLSEHDVSSALTHMNPMYMTYNSAPLWMLLAIFVYSVLSRCFCPSTGDEEDEDDQLVEGLADYYIALKTDDKSLLIGQEETYIKQYGVKTFSDEQFAKLRVAETADVEKIIMGVATYRMLDSLDYQQSFQYEPARKKPDGTCKRDEVIIITTKVTGEGMNPRDAINEPAQQDATYLAVNLAYIPDNKRMMFNMDTSNGKKIFS